MVFSKFFALVVAVLVVGVCFPSSLLLWWVFVF